VLSALIATTAALAGPLTLPPLPSRGIAVATRGGITLLDVRGRDVARLEGYRFVTEYVINSGLPRLRDAAGQRWRLDVARHRLVRARAALPLVGGATLSFGRRTWTVRRGGRTVMRMRVGQEFPFLDEDRAVVSTVRRGLDLPTGRALNIPRGCVLASRRAPAWILLCGHSAYGSLTPTSIEELVGGRRRRIVGPAFVYQGRAAGHWQFVRVAPGGRSLLAQWSGECESPAAFLISRADDKLRPVGAHTKKDAPESEVVGWTTDGRPLIHFTAGVCANGFHGGPGIYSLERSGTARLVVALDPRKDGYAFWD
jgi:hypothetical protein